MSVAELKEKILTRVSEEEAEDVLEDCLRVLNREHAYEIEFTKEDFVEFDKIEKDVEAGNYYTTEQVIENASAAIAEAMKKVRNQAS